MPTILCCGQTCESACAAPPAERLVKATEIRLSEILSAMSVALDITQGNPQGHCMRTALIGMKLADEMRLPTADRSALFYALLLKDLGCSSNAAKMCYLFAADDHLVKRDLRLVDLSKAGERLRLTWRHSAMGGSLLDKLLKMAAITRKGPEAARKISAVRCERGADIARMLRLPESTSRAIYRARRALERPRTSLLAQGRGDFAPGPHLLSGADRRGLLHDLRPGGGHRRRLPAPRRMVRSATGRRPEELSARRGLLAKAAQRRPAGRGWPVRAGRRGAYGRRGLHRPRRRGLRQRG